MHSPPSLRPLSLVNKDNDLLVPSALLSVPEPPTHSMNHGIPNESVTDCVEFRDDPIPPAADTSQSTSAQTEQPIPHSILKSKVDLDDLPASATDLPATNQIPQPLANLVSSGLTTRSRRVPKKSKKLIVLSDEEDEETRFCSIPHCTVTNGYLPMVACNSRVFLF